MIKLYNFGPMHNICDASPFCVKVEAYLKVANIPYQTFSGMKYLNTAPKGKLPFIEDGNQTIPDSGFIVQHLMKNYTNIDADLSAEQKAITHAFVRMIDEHLYWVLSYSRWRLEHNAKTLDELFFGKIPFPINKLVAMKVHADIKSAQYKQGIGRHSPQEVVEIADLDFKAMSELLAQKPYFFGEQPHYLDVAAYSILSQMIMDSPFSAPAFERAKTCQNLVDFTHRFHARYFKG